MTVFIIAVTRASLIKVTWVVCLSNPTKIFLRSLVNYIYLLGGKYNIIAINENFVILPVMGEKKSKGFRAVKKFIVFLSPYWHKGLYAFFFTLLSIGLQLPMPFLTRFLVDKVITIKSYQLLNIIGFVIVGVLLVRVGSTFLEHLYLTTFRGRVMFDIRLTLFEHIQKLSFSFFRKKETGYLMSRISDDVSATQGLLADTLVSLDRMFCFSLQG